MSFAVRADHVTGLSPPVQRTSPSRVPPLGDAVAASTRSWVGVRKQKKRTFRKVSAVKTNVAEKTAFSCTRKDKARRRDISGKNG